MRTSTAAWTAALAVMSMRGPFTTAEAAPARNHPEGERSRYNFPKLLKREQGFTNTTRTLPAQSSSSIEPEVAGIPQSPVTDQSSPPVVTKSEVPTTSSSRMSSSTPWTPDFDPSTWLAGMMADGALPQTANTVVTSTLTKTWETPVSATQTYTITWTETATRTSSSSTAALTSSSSLPAPSAYSPESAVQPSPSSSSPSPPSAPPSAPSSSPSAYVPTSVVQPTPSSSSDASPPPSTPSSSSPSAYSPFGVVQPTPSSSTAPESPSVYAPTSVVQPTSSPNTRTQRRPSDDSPATIVQPTPYTPRTTPTPFSSPSSVVEPTPYLPESSSSSPYAVISSRSFSVPANTSSTAPFGLNATSPYPPTAYSSPSSSSLVPSSSSEVPSGEPWNVPFFSSFLSSDSPSTTADDSPSTRHQGRPGRPTSGNSEYLLETLVQPTPKASATDEATTRTGNQGRPTGWPFNGSPATGDSQLSPDEPSPTSQSMSTSSSNESSASSSSTAPIIVGLSTIIESNVPVPTSEESASTQNPRPNVENPFAGLGLTGLPTSAVLPTPTPASSSAAGANSSDEDGQEGGQQGQGTGRPDFNPFSSLGLSGLPTSLGLPTGVIPTGLPTSTGGNDSNPGRPGFQPNRPDRPNEGSPLSDLGLTGLPTGPLAIPTTLAPPPSENGTAGILPIPLSSPDSSRESGVDGESQTSQTGLAGVLPTTTPSALLPSLSGAITSALSEVTSGAGDILTTDSGSAPTPATIDSTITPPALASIASSLSDQLTSIVATATDSAVSSSLALEYSSVLESAASSLASEASITPQTPVETATAGIPGTTVGTPAPTPGADTATPSYSLSTSTGSDGVTAIPVPITTPTTTTPTTEQVASSADTPSETYESQTAPSGGSTLSTSIPLGTGATIPIASSGTAPASSDPAASPSGYAASQSPSSSNALSSDASGPVVGLPTPSASNTPETTPDSTPEATPGSSAQTTPASSPQSAPQTPQETSIEPTGTNTATDYTLPTSWSFAPTTPLQGTETTGTLAVATSTTGEAAPGLPTYMPRLIQPPGGIPSAPRNTTLIQLGLNYGLNFPFVVREQDSASQIFAYLPQGIAYGLGISHDQVKMNALMPYDTSKSMQFITTLAQAYVPGEYVEQLELDLHTPLSSMYSNPDPMIQALMNMINPTIPILPGASMDGDGSSSADNAGATGGPSSNQGAPIGGDTGESRPVRSSSVGIGVGAVCGAAAYAAAMVYVARRYKRKRQGHQRASSVPTAGEMSESGGGMGGFFMSGGRGSSAAGSGGRGSRTSGHSSNGRSVREQGISAPVMSENSLGWN